MDMRNVPVRNFIPTENLINRGVPKEYANANIDDTRYDADKNSILKKYIENIHDAYEQRVCLCLFGSNGNGKTLFSSIIVKEAYKHRYTSYMITLSNLIDLEFKNRSVEEQEKYDKILNAQFLVIDEVGKEHKTKTGSEIVVLEKILRHSHNKGHVVIICTNLRLYSENGVQGMYERYGKSVESLIDGDSLKIHYDEKDLRKNVFQRKPLMSMLMGGLL